MYQRLRSMIPLLLLWMLTCVPQGWADDGYPMVDEDGDIIVKVNGKPAQGQVGNDMPTILFEAEQTGRHRLENSKMWSAPVMMVWCDSEAEELGRNITDDDAESFVEADLEQGEVYFVILVGIRDEDQGKPFSIGVTTVESETASEASVGASQEQAVVTKSMAGPVTLESGVTVGQAGVTYVVQYDEQGRVMRLDDDQADGYLIEYRRPDETPGLDVWRKDGTYTSYDFHETTNTVSQGRFGEMPEAVMTLDRETGQQITQLADGTQVTAEPNPTGGMTVTTQVPGRAAVQGVIDGTSQSQGDARVVSDEQGRPREVYLAGRCLSSTRYDDQGRVIEVTLDGGGKMQRQYDDRGRLVQSTDVYGNKTAYEYEPDARVVKTILPDGIGMRESYDAQGRVVESVGPGDRTRVIRYADGAPVDVNLVGLDEQTYVPFADGALSLARSSLTGSWVFRKGFDGSIQRTDPLGNTVTFLYSEDQVTTIEDAAHQSLVSYRYDGDRNLTQAVTPSTRVTLAYDQAGHIVSEQTQPADLTITYHYNVQGVLTGLKDSRGNQVTYRLDDNGQVTEICDSQAGTFKLTYGRFALPATLERPNGVTTQWQYDAGGRWQNCTHQTTNGPRSTAYTYNARGLLSKIEREPGEDSSYTYDAAGHWTHVDEHGASMDVKYDPWGQVLQHHNLAFVYDEAGHIQTMEVIGRDLKVPLTCDGAGRMTSVDMLGKLVSMDYDWDHRLAAFKSPETSETFLWDYDGLGRLSRNHSSTKQGEVEQHYVYALGQLYGVLETGRGLDRYIMVPGTHQCLAVIKADGTVLYPLWNHNHSIVALTDAQGKVCGTRTYWSVGGPQAEENMPIATAYQGGLSFAAHTINIKDGQVRMLAFQRAAAAPAPWPHQSSLRSNSPFMSPVIEKTR